MEDKRGRKRRRTRPYNSRWTFEETDILLKKIKESLSTFEKPSAQVYYNKITSSCKLLTKFEWEVVRFKIRNLKTHYMKIRDLWIQAKRDINDEEKLREYVIQLCPHWDLLHEIFEDRLNRPNSSNVNGTGTAERIRPYNFLRKRTSAVQPSSSSSNPYEHYNNSDDDRPTETEISDFLSCHLNIPESKKEMELEVVENGDEFEKSNEINQNRHNDSNHQQEEELHHQQEINEEEYHQNDNEDLGANSKDVEFIEESHTNIPSTSSLIPPPPLYFGRGNRMIHNNNNKDFFFGEKNYNNLFVPREQLDALITKNLKKLFSKGFKDLKKIQGIDIQLEKEKFDAKIKLKHEQLELEKEKLLFEREKLKMEISLRQAELTSEERLKIMELQKEERIAKYELELKYKQQAENNFD